MTQKKVAVITGGASGIGKAIADLFKKHDINVCIIDIKQNDYFIGDIADKETLDSFSQKVIKEFQCVDFLINNAPATSVGINNGTYEDFEYSLRVGLTAPFYLASLFKDHFHEGASIVNIASTRFKQSQPFKESYAAAKGGIVALTHSLAISLAGKVRVNSISPGWIDTLDLPLSKEDHHQHPVRRVGTVADIAEMILYLCSDKAGFITGENICIDGGMSKLMIYNGDFGWKYDRK